MYVECGERWFPSITADPLMPSQPMSPTSTRFSPDWTATTDAIPVSMKYTSSIGRFGFSRSCRSLSTTGSRCAFNNWKSRCDNLASRRLRCVGEAASIALLPSGARALHSLPSVRAQMDCGRRRHLIPFGPLRPNVFGLVRNRTGVLTVDALDASGAETPLKARTGREPHLQTRHGDELLLHL